VRSAAIVNSHRDGVVARASSCETVLAIQDTTDFDFTTHPATAGLGFINQSTHQGFKVHSCFAVSGTGEPLGILEQLCWNRQQRRGQKEQRRKNPIEQKESHRWLSTLTAAEQSLPDTVQVVHIGDREADIFELFAQPRAANSELLIRATHNRKVNHELGYLIPTLNQAPIQGEITLELEQSLKRPVRTAQLQLRALQVSIEVPGNHPKPHSLRPVTLNALLVEEKEIPADGSQPICWLLLTTLPIDTFEQLWQCVRWYSYRWLIEIGHRGCSSIQ